MLTNLENSKVNTGMKKVHFHSNIKERQCSNYCTVAIISHASKVILKIFQVRLQQYMNQELSDVQAGFRKGRGTRDQIANICWIIESKRIPEKTSTSVSLTTLKPLTVWNTIKSRKILKWREYQTTLPASWETCMQAKKQQLEQTWNNGLFKNWERGTLRLYTLTLLI